MIAVLVGLSILSLATSLTTGLLRCIYRALRTVTRRRRHCCSAHHNHGCSAHHKPSTTTGPAAGLAVEVEELRRCVHWLIWALSREVSPETLTGSARATDPTWWPTLARVRATIDHLATASPDLEVAAWCLHVIDIDHRATGATR